MPTLLGDLPELRRLFIVPGEFTVRVARCGRICFGRLKVNLSTVFQGQLVGLREVEERLG